MSDINKLTIKEREFVESFQKKLSACLMKRNGESPYTWKELVEQLNLGIHPDTLSRTAGNFYDFHRYLQLLKKMEDISNEVDIDYLNNQTVITQAIPFEDVGIESDIDFDKMLERISKREIKVKQKEVLQADKERELNTILRENARGYDISNCMQECADKISKSRPFYEYEVILPNEEDIVQEGILLLSDIHYGLETEHYWNVFNDSVFNLRWQYLTQETIRLCKFHNIKKLNLMGLGDYINGLIHTTTRLESRKSASEQTLEVAECISNLVYNIASALPNMYIVLTLVDDNHSRIFAKKDEGTDSDTFVDFMRTYIKIRLNEKNDKGEKKLKNVLYLENHIDGGITSIDVCGYNIVGVHGDKDKYGETSLVRMVQLLGKPIHYFFMGHGHTPKEENFGESELIMNGCFSGTSLFAKNIRRNSKPVQKFIIMERNYGKRCVYDIDVRGRH